MVRLTILALLLFMGAMAQAQPGEKLEALRTSYITTELDLTPEEAEQFWPIYNQNQQQLRKLQKQEMQLVRDIRKNMDESSEAEARQKLEQLLKIERQKGELQTNSTYMQLADIIGPKRVLKLKQAEMEFKKRMLRELAKRRMKKRGLRGK